MMGDKDGCCGGNAAEEKKNDGACSTEAKPAQTDACCSTEAPKKEEKAEGGCCS